MSGPNYDEFQNDAEVRALIRERPHSILRITMPHCDSEAGAPAAVEGSPAALESAQRNLAALRASGLVRGVHNVLWAYAMETPGRRQIGLGGLAHTAEIRTNDNPRGVVIRNEGIRPDKAIGRAELIRHTRVFTDCVNLAVDDRHGQLKDALSQHAAGRAPDFEVADEQRNRHRVWMIEQSEDLTRFRQLLAAEPFAYVADGNHRSAAAAMLGREDFLAVFFPIATMQIAPYNRLIKAPGHSGPALERELSVNFRVERLPAGVRAYAPEHVHEIGFYSGRTWFKLAPKASSFDESDAAQSIDADIVQRNLFAAVFQIADARDPRLTFVGGNRDVSYLVEQVDSGGYNHAVTLAPVTLRQFVDVCLQNRFMPPKSTWFVPKVQSGLICAEFD